MSACNGNGSKARKLDANELKERDIERRKIMRIVAAMTKERIFYIKLILAMKNEFTTTILNAN